MNFGYRVLKELLSSHDHVHTEAVSRRRVGLQRRLRLLRRRLGGTACGRYGDRPVCEQHADVAAHGDEHLAQRLGLSSSSIADLVEAYLTPSTRFAMGSEVGGQFLNVVRVFHGVMQQCSLTSVGVVIPISARIVATAADG